MFDDSILEPIRKAIWEAKRDYKNVLKIHVTYDFYMQVKAKCTPPVPDIQKPFEYPIFGYSVVEHVEPCEKEWWFEIEGEYIPQPANEAWRSALAYHEKRPTTGGVDLLSCPQCGGKLHNGFCNNCKAAFGIANC